MDWLVGIALILVLYLVFVLTKKKQTPAPTTGHSESRTIKALRQFEGRDCIYTNGSLALKSQVRQIEAVDNLIRFSLQPLHTEGLSEIHEPTIMLHESAGSIEQATDLIHAPYGNWRLYFNRDLIHHISVIAKKGADMKIIQRTILDFRAEPGDLTP